MTFRYQGVDQTLTGAEYTRVVSDMQARFVAADLKNSVFWPSKPVQYLSRPGIPP
jgi:hypothetical protein